MEIHASACSNSKLGRIFEHFLLVRHFVSYLGPYSLITVPIHGPIYMAVASEVIQLEYAWSWYNRNIYLHVNAILFMQLVNTDDIIYSKFGCVRVRHSARVSLCHNLVHYVLHT